MARSLLVAPAAEGVGLARRRTTPLEARPVSAAGPCILVSKAAALAGYWPSS